MRDARNVTHVLLDGILLLKAEILQVVFNSKAQWASVARLVVKLSFKL